MSEIIDLEDMDYDSIYTQELWSLYRVANNGLHVWWVSGFVSDKHISLLRISFS